MPLKKSKPTKTGSTSRTTKKTSVKKKPTEKQASFKATFAPGDIQWNVPFLDLFGLDKTPEKSGNGLRLSDYATGPDVPQPPKKDTNPKDAIGVGKVPMSCLSFPVLMEMGLGMYEGGAKYGKFNFRAIGVRSSVYLDACFRHLAAWYEGEDLDQDSGVSHLVKAMTTLMVLRDAQMRGKMNDDRPPGTSGFISAMNEKAKKIADKADPNVKHYFTDHTQDIYQP